MSKFLDERGVKELWNKTKKLVEDNSEITITDNDFEVKEIRIIDNDNPEAILTRGEADKLYQPKSSSSSGGGGNFNFEVGKGDKILMDDGHSEYFYELLDKNPPEGFCPLIKIACSTDFDYEQLVNEDSGTFEISLDFVIKPSAWEEMPLSDIINDYTTEGTFTLYICLEGHGYNPWVLQMKPISTSYGDVVSMAYVGDKIKVFVLKQFFIIDGGGSVEVEYHTLNF